MFSFSLGSNNFQFSAQFWFHLLLLRSILFTFWFFGDVSIDLIFLCENVFSVASITLILSEYFPSSEQFILVNASLRKAISCGWGRTTQRHQGIRAQPSWMRHWRESRHTSSLVLLFSPFFCLFFVISLSPTGAPWTMGNGYSPNATILQLPILLQLRWDTVSPRPSTQDFS